MGKQVAMLGRMLSLGVARGLSTLSMLTVLAYLSRIMSLEKYALLREFFLYLDLALPIILLGSPALVPYYLSTGMSVRMVFNKSMSIVFSIFSVIFLMVSTIYYFNKSDSNSFILIYLSIILALLASPGNILSPVLVYINKVRLLVISSIGSSVLFIGLTVFFCSLGFENESGFIARFLSLLALSIFNYTIFQFHYKSTVMTTNHVEQPSNLKFIGKSSAVGISGLVTGLSFHIDKIIVSVLGSAAEFAIFSNGAMEVPFIGIITGSVTSIAVAVIAKKIKEKKVIEAVNLFKVCTSLTAVLIFPLFTFLLLFSDFLIVALYSSAYEESATIFSIYILAMPVRIIGFSSIIIALGMSHELLVRSITELGMNIILSLFLYENSGYLGVAWATVITTYLYLVPANFILIIRRLKVGLLDLLDVYFLL